MAGKAAATKIENREATADVQALIVTAVQHIDIPIFIKGKDRRWVYVNQAACEFLGASGEELLGKTIHEVLPKRDADFIDFYDNKIFHDGLPVAFEWKTEVQGTIHSYVVKKVCFAEPGGKQYVIGYFYDVTECRKVEQEKTAQEQYSHSLFENTGSSMIIFNNDCVITSCNAHFERMTGFSKQEILHSMTWMDFIASWEAERLMDRHNRRLDPVAPPPREVEIDFLTKGGEVRTAHAVLAVIPETTDRIVSVVDITERKQMERALAESLKKYEALLETTDTGYVIITGDGFVLDANDEYCRLAGRPREQVLGHRAREWTVSSEFSVAREAVGQCLEKGKLYQLQTYYQHSDGTVLAVEANATRIEHDGETLIMSLIRDISERKQAEDAMRASEQHLRSLVDNMPVLIHAYDRNGKVVFWNKECERVLGWSAEELLGMPAAHNQLYSSPEYLNQIMRGDNSVSGSYCEWEVPMVSKDGEIRMISWTSRSTECPLPGWHLWQTGVDVTERRQYLAKLADLNKHLEALVDERTAALKAQTKALEIVNKKLQDIDTCKSSFLNAVSHEIRTPLTSILGFVRLIEREFDSFEKVLAVQNADYEKRTDRVVANFRIIQEEGSRLKRLINDFLDLSKIESGQIRWNDRRVDFVTLAGRVRSVYSGSNLRNKAVDLVLRFADQLPVLAMDPDRLLQILFNLLDNAFKFTLTGRVELRVDSPEPDHVRFIVSDTGIGMEADVLQNIFDEFYQVYRTDTMVPENRGTGIGLAVCRLIVAHYQGKIWAESELGRGTQVYVRLPCRFQ